MTEIDLGLDIRHGHKYSKYKKCLSIIMLICIKQQLRNILKLNSCKS